MAKKKNKSKGTKKEKKILITAFHFLTQKK